MFKVNLSHSCYTAFFSLPWREMFSSGLKIQRQSLGRFCPAETWRMKHKLCKNHQVGMVFFIIIIYYFSKISMELTVFRIDFGFHEFRMVDTCPSFCLGWHGILNLHTSMSRHVLPYLISREVYNPPSTHRFEPSLDERKI